MRCTHFINDSYIRLIAASEIAELEKQGKLDKDGMLKMEDEHSSTSSSSQHDHPLHEAFVPNGTRS
jgi:hypothetical protein